jgi:bifunctional non-homologous end joining protein LigD
MPMALRFIQPCRPIAAKTIPAGDAWQHEPKLDGYRLQVAKDGRAVRLYSRRGADWTKRLPALADALKAIPCRSAILDAELVLPSASGAPDFYGLLAGVGKRQHELAVFAFDLLSRDGRDLRTLPLIERRRRLQRLLGRSDIPCLYLMPSFEDGAQLLTTAEQFHLEGVVSNVAILPIAPGTAGTGAR